MRPTDTLPCWTCALCRRPDGIQDPESCPYEDGWCRRYRAWAGAAWRSAVAPFQGLSRPEKSRQALEAEMWTRYRDGKSDVDIERELGLYHGKVFQWRERHRLPANHNPRGWGPSYWTVYLAKTDEVIAQGTREEVIEQMGTLSAQSFRSTVAGVKAGRNRKYVILKDGKDVRERDT